MINILVCEAGEGYGGSAAYLFSFLRRLDKEVFCPMVVFSRKADGPFIQKIRDLDLEVEFLEDKRKAGASNTCSGSFCNLWGLIPAYLIRKLTALYRRFVLLYRHMVAIYRLVRLIRKRNIQLVFINQEVYANPSAVLAAAICRVPSVVRKAGIALYRGKTLLRLLSYFPTVLIASSNAEYQNHIDSGFPFKKMVTIWEGVDVTEFSPSSQGDEVRKELGIPLESLVIGSISRIDEGKGHEDLLQAAGVVLKEISNAVFLIVGDRDESIKAELKSLARELDIEDKVIFAGWRTDVARILHSVDVFVHCPNAWLEGMGIATLEAIACGKPVVITKNWGLVDTTEDGYNGFIVPIGDYRTLADKIILLLKDNDLRKRMGENSRERAVREFDVRKNVRSIEKIMLGVLNGAELALQP